MVLDAMSVRDLRWRLELLATSAVEPLVLRHEQVVGAALLDALEQGDHAADVPGLGRANPVVVAALESPPVVGERRGHPVYPRLRRHAATGGGLDHRLTVLVHPHQEMNVVAAQP